VLLEPAFVGITAEEERHAVEALAELPAPLFLQEPATKAADE